MNADNPHLGQLEKGQPIMGTTFTPGQLAQLSHEIGIGVATALPRVAEKYDPKVVLKALEGHGEIFAGHIETALEQALNSMLILAPKGVAMVTLNEPHDPDAFYQTRSGLYVYDDFRTRVVAKARPSGNADYKVEKAELMRGLTDEEIEGALPKNHLFDETRLCAIIAGLITKQPNGEEGVLLNNSYANLFYTSSCVVLVDWLSDYREWRVYTWRRGGRRWLAGYQVFSPGN